MLERTSLSLLSCSRAPEEELVANNLSANKIFSDIEDLPFPSVTAINGIALGGGCEMCLSTDYRVMSTAAKIGVPEVKLGIFPDSVVQFVSRV